jgi:hypothetical protein
LAITGHSCNLELKLKEKTFDRLVLFKNPID